MIPRGIFVSPRCTPESNDCCGARNADDPDCQYVRPLASPKVNAYTRSDSDIMRADIRELRNIIEDLCGALLYSDDFCTVERKTAEMGLIYRDTNFKTFRQPLYTRVALRNVMRLHHITATPVIHSWVYNISRSARIRISTDD